MQELIENEINCRDADVELDLVIKRDNKKAWNRQSKVRWVDALAKQISEWQAVDYFE